MSARLAPGLMRLCNRAPIWSCDYDFDTETIGLIKIELPVGYAMPYSSDASKWSRHDMWAAIASDENVLACIVANNTFLAMVYENGVLVYRKGKQKTEMDTRSPVQRLFEPDVPVGFVKTVPEFKDVTIPPYYLFRDKQGRVALSPGICRWAPDSVPCRDSSLYAQLVKTKYDAVCRTADSCRYFII